jgi:hypothetical protein
MLRPATFFVRWITFYVAPKKTSEHVESWTGASIDATTDVYGTRLMYFALTYTLWIHGSVTSCRVDVLDILDGIWDWIQGKIDL